VALVKEFVHLLEKAIGDFADVVADFSIVVDRSFTCRINLVSRYQVSESFPVGLARAG
jgi:hypothetical protein